jgi:uncharacterized Fe-S cluster-containing MiaB family protein
VRQNHFSKPEKMAPECITTTFAQRLPFVKSNRIRVTRLVGIFTLGSFLKNTEIAQFWGIFSFLLWAAF